MKKLIQFLLKLIDVFLAGRGLHFLTVGRAVFNLLRIALYLVAILLAFLADKRDVDSNLERGGYFIAAGIVIFFAADAITNVGHLLKVLHDVAKELRDKKTGHVFQRTLILIAVVAAHLICILALFRGQS